MARHRRQYARRQIESLLRMDRDNELRAFSSQPIDDRQRRTLSHVVDVFLVGNAEQQARATPFIALRSSFKPSETSWTTCSGMREFTSSASPINRESNPCCRAFHER